MKQLCQRHGIPADAGAGIGPAGSRNRAPDENIAVADFFL